MLKILGRVTSINVRKVLWAADELGLQYEREDWGMPIRDPKVPEFLALNPNGQVPVMLDNGFVLWESNAIIRYLAEGAPTGHHLIPGDRHDRALMEQWLGWMVSELNATWLYAYLAYGRPTPGYDDPTQIRTSIERWTKKMSILEAALGDGRFFIAGDRLTLADIGLGLGVHRWYGTPFDKRAFPHIERYYAALKARPAGARYLGPSTP